MVIAGRRAVTFHFSVSAKKNCGGGGDRISFDRFLLMANLTHFFMYLFISSLYMFRASQCSSSGGRIVLIHNMV